MQFKIGNKRVWLNYQHLYYFLVIAKEGAISKAAEKLQLGQPTLSTQLKQLEDTLELQLFERKHKKLILTEVGKVVQDYATEIFKTGSEMLEVAYDRLPEQRTHVQMGALDSVPKSIMIRLAKAAGKIGKSYVSILEGKGDELIRELLSHRIDLVVSNHLPNILEERGIHSRKIAHSSICVCGTKKFAKLKKRFPQSLDGIPFILPTSHSKLRQDLDHFFRLNDIHPDLTVETQDTAIQKMMAAEGLGVVALPQLSVGKEFFFKSLSPLGTLKGVHEDFYLISATRKLENPISSRLMREFKIQ